MSILVNYTYHIHFTPILSKCSVYRNHTFSWSYQTIKCDLINSVFKTRVLKTLFLENALFKIAYSNRPLNRIQRTRVLCLRGRNVHLSYYHDGKIKLIILDLWLQNRVSYSQVVRLLNSFENVLTNEIVWVLVLFWKKKSSKITSNPKNPKITTNELL